MVAVLSQPGRVRVCEPCPLITVMLSDLGDCHLAHLNWPTHRVCPAGAAAVAGAVAAGAGVLAAAFLSSSAFFLASSAFFFSPRSSSARRRTSRRRRRASCSSACCWAPSESPWPADCAPSARPRSSRASAGRRRRRCRACRSQPTSARPAGAGDRPSTAQRRLGLPPPPSFASACSRPLRPSPWPPPRRSARCAPRLRCASSLASAGARPRPSAALRLGLLPLGLRLGQRLVGLPLGLGSAATFCVASSSACRSARPLGLRLALGGLLGGAPGGGIGLVALAGFGRRRASISALSLASSSSAFCRACARLLELGVGLPLGLGFGFGLAPRLVLQRAAFRRPACRPCAARPAPARAARP